MNKNPKLPTREHGLRPKPTIITWIKNLSFKCAVRCGI